MVQKCLVVNITAEAKTLGRVVFEELIAVDIVNKSSSFMVPELRLFRRKSLLHYNDPVGIATRYGLDGPGIESR